MKKMKEPLYKEAEKRIELRKLSKQGVDTSDVEETLPLRKFSLLKEFRKIKPFSIEFKERLNIVVGENGSGKSTLFSLLTDNEYYKIVKLEHEPDMTFRFFDTEKQNPRIKASIDYSKNPMYDMISRFASHGEVMMPILRVIENFKNVLIFVDEPEAGISLTNQKKILDSFNVAVKNGCQIIISTHSYFIIKNTKKVFNMETKKWELSKTFLDRLENE